MVISFLHRNLLTLVQHPEVLTTSSQDSPSGEDFYGPKYGEWEQRIGPVSFWWAGEAAKNSVHVVVFVDRPMRSCPYNWQQRQKVEHPRFVGNFVSPLWCSQNGHRLPDIDQTS